MNTATSVPIWINIAGWTLLHSLWQGLAIYAALRIILKSIPVTRAGLRYAVSYLALLSIMVWSGYSFIGQWNRMRTVEVLVTEHATTQAVTRTYTIATQTPPDAGASWISMIIPQPERYFPYFMILYFTGLCMMMIRIAAGAALLYRTRYRQIVPAARMHEDLLTQLMQRSGIQTPVRMFLSGYVTTPVVMGIIRPVIILPVALTTQLSADQLEAILLHELAHIRRKDYLLNLVQVMLETILFYNPFVWLISSLIRKEREHCCDDMVLSYAPAFPYATALASLAEHRVAGFSPALAANGQKKHLFTRIKRIMEMKKHSLHRGRFAASLLLVLLIAIGFVWLSPSFAQSYKNKKKTSSTSTTSKIIVIDNNGVRTVYQNEAQLPADVKETLRRSMAAADTAMSMAGLAPVPSDAAGFADTLFADEWNSVDGSMIAPVPPAPLRAPIAPIAPAAPNYHQALEEAHRALELAHKELSEVDWKRINKEVDNAMKEVDWKKMQRDMDRAMAELKTAELDNEKLRADIERSVNDAMREVNAMAPPAPSANRYDRMIQLMDEEGLLESDGNYKIERDEDGSIHVNGQQLGVDRTRRYNRFFDEGSTLIKKRGGKFTITNSR